jgi:hypothetical protein
MLIPFRSIAAISLGLVVSASLTGCTSDADNPMYHDQTAPNPNHTGRDSAVTPQSPGGPVRNQNDEPKPADPPSGRDRQQPASRWYV